MSNVNLIGLTRNELRSFAESINEESYRGDQIFSWIYQYNEIKFSRMTNLSKGFRSNIENSAFLNLPKISDSVISKETSSIKFLFKLNDGLSIETVFIPEQKRNTVCLSSQVGCALDCKFCATAKMGFIANLNPGEIVDQFLLVNKSLEKPITNVVFMGMGEPFLNYNNVIKAADLLHDPNGINLGYKRITISTAGIVKKINQFSNEGQKYKLAISLNGTTNEQRLAIMPVTKNNSLNSLLEASKKYTTNSNRWLTFEYVLIEGINDTIEDASRLIEILVGVKKCKLNIIPYNVTDGIFKRPEDAHIKEFMKRLNHAPFPVTIRWSKGTGIDAGCGQLATTEKLMSN